MTPEQGSRDDGSTPAAADGAAGPAAGGTGDGGTGDGGTGDGGTGEGGRGPDGRAPSSSPRRPSRKQVPLRLDPAVHEALARWAADDLRSVNAQIEMLLRRALKDAGRLPRDARPPRRPGRPPSDP